MTKIYLITTFEKMNPKDEYGILETGCRRSVGYYLKLADAEEIVKNNICDLWETIYDYAIIEEIDEGIYPFVENKWFYKYNIELNKYELMKNIPEQYQNSYNLGGII